MKTLNFFFIYLLLSISSVVTAKEKPLVVSSASMFTYIANNIGVDLIVTETIVPI